ncbi:MAG: polysaccharide deacetylase, partial [Steroidobacteraceae bacterium]|nr:polysaccharide deacetylase [Steroidobacteraceae bacterium]
DLLALLKKQGFEIVTLEEAQSDPIYETDPDFPEARGGTLVELLRQSKGLPWPANAPTQPRERIAELCL